MDQVGIEIRWASDERGPARSCNWIRLGPYYAVAPYTHTSNFFHRFAGQHQRPNWETADSLELTLDNLSPDWRVSSGYDKALIASNRNYYDFSVGLRLQLRIPYEQAQDIEKQGEKAMINWMETQVRAMKQVVVGSTLVDQ